MQLTYYCRLYEASPYNMQIDRATFIALSFVKPKGLIIFMRVFFVKVVHLMVL